MSMPMCWMSGATGCGQLAGVPRLLGAIAASGMAVSVCTSFAIVYFNRPRWMVPPFMRSELGITTAWWRSRHRGSSKRKAP
jgi:hypothetical protein